MSSASRKREGHFLSLQKVTRLPGRDPAPSLNRGTPHKSEARSRKAPLPTSPQRGEEWMQRPPSLPSPSGGRSQPHPHPNPLPQAGEGEKPLSHKQRRKTKGCQPSTGLTAFLAYSARPASATSYQIYSTRKMPLGLNVQPVALPLEPRLPSALLRERISRDSSLALPPRPTPVMRTERV